MRLLRHCLNSFRVTSHALVRRHSIFTLTLVRGEGSDYIGCSCGKMWRR